MHRRNELNAPSVIYSLSIETRRGSSVVGPCLPSTAACLNSLRPCAVQGRRDDDCSQPIVGRRPSCPSSIHLRSRRRPHVGRPALEDDLTCMGLGDGASPDPR
ncbi:hypothetical protein PVAP13_4NG029262 [Panicum virgatum]|uniref:Uncharacterized protein n=1 Tax=Panicum virgatum TaxID=38727 RepID=A0A8T0T2E8_PANVG|nr:hypothetical protein PVAP13_4NG029262 [Panicum virgatum]